jgi:uncharacterized protein GlcG (DUF336 family)
MTVAAGAIVALGVGSEVKALDQKPVLTLEIANKMADACEAAQAANGWRPLNIAIVDDGGNLKLFRRQENAFLGSISISQDKAWTSAMFPFSTRTVAEISFGKAGEPAMVPGLAFSPGLAAFAGGLPIMTAGGQQIGGIGVSGASADEDEMCAQAGIDAVKDMLK